MSCITIKDGTGKGYQAKVDANNMIRARVVSESVEHYANYTLGLAFSLYFNVTPTGANDCFFYFKNTNTHPIVFEGFAAYAASAEAIDVYLKHTGTPSGGSTLTETNLNTSSASSLDATIQYGNDITGLSGGSLAYRYYIPANSSTNSINFEQDIIVYPQTTLTLYAVNGAINIVGHMDCHIDTGVES